MRRTRNVVFFGDGIPRIEWSDIAKERRRMRRWIRRRYPFESHENRCEYCAWVATLWHPRRKLVATIVVAWMRS